MSPAGMPAVQPLAPAGYPSAIPTSNVAYGGFWIRFVALIIDYVILGAVLLPVRAVLAGIFGLGAIHHLEQGDLSDLFVLIPTLQLLWTGAGWLYEALLLSSPWQATLGKKALGLRVTDESGNRITFLRATGRHFAKYVSVMTLFIGFIMAGFTDRKRALHDMIAGTLVMKELRY